MVTLSSLSVARSHLRTPLDDAIIPPRGALIETSVVPNPHKRLCAPLLILGCVQQSDTTTAIREQTEDAYVVLAVMVAATRWQHAWARW
jgi:hypothetical protein